MNTMLIAGILTAVRAVLVWLTARQNGDRDAALQILSATDLRPFGLDNQALMLTNYAKAGLAYITNRGVLVDQVIELINLADAENRDVTADEIQEYLDLTKVELDETQKLIDELKNEE